MANDKICMVKNRSSSMVVYRIPEEGIRREFQPGEVKKIPYVELEKITYQSGGRALIANFLQITDETVTDDLNIVVEPEYYMSETQIAELLANGSLDAFLDCLDNAPAGVIDLIKQYSISLPLNDIEKRAALKEKTGFDVTVALENLRQEKAVDEGDKPAAPATTPKRRTTVNYKVVEKKEPVGEAESK